MYYVELWCDVGGYDHTECVVARSVAPTESDASALRATKKVRDLALKRGWTKDRQGRWVCPACQKHSLLGKAA